MDQVAIVSFDITAHATAPQAVQRERVEAIGRIVRATLARSDVESFWASGGDGGHVLFLSRAWQVAAADLLSRLWRWARTEDVPLRITGHAGSVDRVVGADGAVQFVGEAINTAGRLLELRLFTSVVTSDEFRAAFVATNTVDAVFHDPKWVNLRHRSGCPVFLLSIYPELQSQWPPELEGDDALLNAALAERDGWTVIYRAKRLMQADGNSRVAERAIRRLSASQLRCATPSAIDHEVEQNPLLAPLDAPSRVELVRMAMLVERKPNEFICRSGEDGDIMFVLLAGEVGIVRPPAADEARVEDLAPALALGAGDIVGELAFALRRPRTASVVALSEVALLGFQYGEVEARLRNAPLAREAVRRLDRFISERVLEHLYEQAPDLVPVEPDEDLQGELSRTGPLENTLACTSLVKVDPHAVVSREALADAGRVDADGVYLLASGALRSSSIEDKRVEAGRYRLLYANLPGLVITPDHEYVVERGAVIVHIAQPAILALDPEYRDKYIAGLRRQARDCYHYDVFLSYAFQDAPIVEGWEQAMRARGLRVYRDELRIGHQFPARLEAALADSLVVVAFLSANTNVNPPDENWVRREIEFRERLFGRGAPVIVPVILFGGNPEAIASGHTPINATGNEEQALIEVAEVVWRIRQGEEDAPFARHGGPRGRVGSPAPNDSP